MSYADRTGQRIPEVTFKIRNDDHWETLTSADLFKSKRVILFALPGAFTPTCSSVHLPRYNELYDMFKKNGIDDVLCLAVNDSFVLNEWKKVEHADKVRMIPDGNGEFSEKMGLLVDKGDLCFGKRSRRYSMVVKDGVIEKMFVEPEEEGDPFGRSSAESMLAYLNPKEIVPPSVTVFTREGCLFCTKAKNLLKENNYSYDEMKLHEHFSIKTVKALSGTTKLPQVFIDGTRIGGADDLENFLNSRH
jgi:glutathione-dependent peroxiredoxin